METSENLNLKPIKCVCVFLILLGLCLYFTNISSPAGAVRGYFLFGFTLLFLIFGISFSDYIFTTYKKYFFDYALRFIIYAAIYSAFLGIVILVAVLNTNNNLKFTTNASTVINSTKFLFTNFWFIITGLLILLSLPFLNKMLKKVNSAVLFMSVILTIALNEIIAPFIPNNVFSLRDLFEFLRYILFYGLFTLIGLSYKKILSGNEKNKTILPFFIIICLILISACLIIYGYNYDLIKHFYPPTLFLAVYHLLIFAVFLMLTLKLNVFSSFFKNKEFTRYISDFSLELIFILPVLLYLLSLLFNALKIADFLNKYFIAGFLIYFSSSLVFLILSYFVVNLIKKRIGEKGIEKIEKTTD